MNRDLYGAWTWRALLLPMIFGMLQIGCGSGSGDPVAPVDGGVDGGYVPTCGDGVAEGAEECDDGADNGAGGPLACGADCSLVAPTGSIPVEPEPSASTLAAVRADMETARTPPNLSGQTFGGLVWDLDADREIYANGADALLIPASNTKIFTTAAAIDLLGEDHRMQSRVFADGPIDSAGRLSGNLNLHGEHDFTWSRWFHADPRDPLDALADELYRAGLRTVAGELGVYGAYCYEGHHFATYTPSVHRQRVLDAFGAALSDRGISVEGGANHYATMDVPSGTELAHWDSPPLWVGAWPINRKSHNEMADILMRHIGYLLGGSSDYATGAAVVLGWLADAGVDTTGAIIEDGSGLDTDNRLSARMMVGLYQYMRTRPSWPAFRSGLSVGGGQGPASNDSNDFAIVTSNVAPYNGTLAYRMTGADTAGRVFGKSGTNLGITTSGVLHHGYDGHRYAFAFLMNDITGFNSDARVAHDAMVAVFAADLTGAGARPRPPVLRSVRNAGDGRSVRVEWSASPDIAPGAGSGYVVEVSSDGLTWPTSDRVFTPELGVRLGGYAPGDRVFVRIRAANAAGLGEPTDGYGAGVGLGSSEVLLVDGNDRWERQPTNENLRGAAHDFLASLGRATSGRAFDSADNDALIDGAVRASDYRALVWSAAEEAATDESFSEAEAALLSVYLGSGGALLVSGAEIGWDLDPAGNGAATATDTAFLTDDLGAAYVGDDAATFAAVGREGGPFADLGRVSFWTPGEIFVAYPDRLAPSGGGSSCMDYVGGTGDGACVIDASGRVIFMGFPLESVDLASARRAIITGALAHFGL